MTVAELITLLNKSNPAKEVVVFINGHDEPITSVEFDSSPTNQPVVLYYGEDQ